MTGTLDVDSGADVVGRTAVDPGPILSKASSHHGRGRRLLDGLSAGVHRPFPEMVVVVGSLLLGTWALGQNGYGSTYYAAAVRSMGASWHNFVYASFDPGGWITLDKPPFAFWVTTAVTKVFGYSSWTLLGPSAVAGAAAVGLVIATVRPLWGRTAGLAAGVCLAVTPAAVAVSRSNNPDGLLMMLAVAAAWATGHALRGGRTRWILVAGGFVGLALLTKLLAALLVLPALWLAFLVAGPGTWRRRAAQLAAGSAVVMTITAAWVALVDLTPASQRPFVGGSTDGTARDLVFGYNGFGRVLGQSIGPGGSVPGGGAPGGALAAFGGSAVDPFGGSPGLGRLLNRELGDQILWLAPLAIVAGVVGLVVAAHQLRRDAHLGLLVLLTTWAAVAAVVFSTAQGIFDNYYASLLAPPIAGLVGFGVAEVRSGSTAARRWAAAALVATAAVQLVLLARVAAWEWLLFVVPAGLVVAAAFLTASAVPAMGSRRYRLMAIGLSMGLAVALVAPAVWVSSLLQRRTNGFFPFARPVALGLPDPGAGGFGGLGGLSAAELDWLRAQRTTERWLVAVSSTMQASDAIIAGESVMAMGGFIGTDPAMTTDRFAGLVERGELRYIVAGGLTPFGTAADVATAVTRTCTAVPPSAWAGPGSTPGTPETTAAGSLYDCHGQADALRSASIRTAVPDQLPPAVADH